MPETIEAPPIQAAAPELTGIDKAIQAFDADITPAKPDKPAEPAKPEAKPDAKAQPEKDAPKPEAKQPEPESEDADEKIIKANPKAWKVYDSKRKKWEGETKTLRGEIEKREARIKEIEAKPKEAPADAKLIESYQKQIEELKSDLRQGAYERSPEFKKQFKDRYDSEMADALADVKSLRVTIADAEGQTSQRPATENDFRKVMALPIDEQDAAIHQLFGVSAHRVINRINELNRIKREGFSAIAKANEEAGVRAKEAETMTQKQQQDYDSLREKSRNAIIDKYPQFFKEPADDPQAAEDLKKGWDWVRQAEASIPSLSPDERAATVEVMMAKAAGFSMQANSNARKDVKIAALEKELLKYRGGEPTPKDKGTTISAPESSIGGIMGAAKAFDLNV